MAQIMEVVLQSTFAGQECINRFNYLANGTPVAVQLSFALASAFGAIYEPAGTPIGYQPNTLFDRIRSAASAQVKYDIISVKDVYSVTDFYEVPFVQDAYGKLVGQALSPISALGFRTGRVRSDIRRGMKRFVGLTEGVVGEAGVIDNPFKTDIVLPLATALGAVLTYDDEGNTITFSPVVVGKERLEPDPPEHPNVRYRYYETEAEQLDHLAAGIVWSPYDYVRSQVSRQYGRGR